MACSSFAGLNMYILGGKGNWQSPSILGKLSNILPYLYIGKVDKERGV